MKLDGDRIVIESRYEINDLIRMIELYEKQGKFDCVTQKELTELKDRLDALFMSW